MDRRTLVPEGGRVLKLDTLVLAASLGLCAAFAGATAAIAVQQPAAMDETALYAAARLVVTGHGRDILDSGTVLAAERRATPDRTALLPFVQPPAIALLLAPIALLPFGAAYMAMAGLEALALLAALLLLARGRARRPALALTLAFLAPPSVLAIAHAQTSPLVLLLLAIAARAGPRAGGLALGATLLRPQTAPLLLLAGLLDRGRRLPTVVGALTVVAASAAVVGPDGLARYVAALADAGRWSVTGQYGLASSIGWAGPAVELGMGVAGIGLAVVSLLVGAIAVARERGAGIVSAGAWSLLASPHVLMHDAVLAYPALIGIDGRSPLWLAGAALGWLAHMTVAPVGVLVSLAVALGVSPRREGSTAPTVAT